MTAPQISTLPAMIVSGAFWLAMVMLAAAFLLTVWRVMRGPTLADRVVALDMLTGIAIGFIALIAIRTGFTLYVDIAIALGLVGFLATVAFARFILARGGGGERSGESFQALEATRPTRKRIESADATVDRPAVKPTAKTAGKAQKTGKRAADSDQSTRRKGRK